MFHIKRILVPIDFSPLARNALETAIAISKRQLSAITLIHVVENTYVLFPPEAGGASGALLPELVKNANKNLSELAKELRVEHDIVVNHIVQSGNPADEICRWALHKSCDLIVMGTHGVSGLREFFLGSNAYRVVRNAPSPVLTVPGTNQWLDFRKVLFPVRMVPEALDKYDFVRPIIRSNGSSMLVAGLIHKNDPEESTEMNSLVDLVKKKIAEDDVIYKSEIHFTDDVAREVLDISEKEKPDLIVITATLDKSIRNFFMGPYTQNIVNHAHYPVLSIQPGNFRKAFKAESDLIFQ